MMFGTEVGRKSSDVVLTVVLVLELYLSTSFTYLYLYLMYEYLFPCMCSLLKMPPKIVEYGFETILELCH